MALASELSIGTRVRSTYTGALGTVKSPVMGTTVETAGYVAVNYDKGVGMKFYQGIDRLEVVTVVPVVRAPRTTRKSSHFKDTVFIDNQVAWLSEVGANSGTDVWETVAETLIRKGYYTREEADAKSKVDAIERKWRAARLYNEERGIYVISSESGYRNATKEEFEMHTPPLDIAGGK